MNHYAIYDVTTGRITQTLTSPDLESVELGLLPGQATLEFPSELDASTYYVSGGEAVSMGTRPGPHHEFDYATGTWFDPRTISDLRETKWAEIKKARDTAEFGGFEWDGSTFDSDLASQSRIQGAAQLAQLTPEFTIDWTLQDNSVRTLDATGMIAVGIAMGVHVSAAHAYGRSLRAQIEAAQSAEEINAIHW